MKKCLPVMLEYNNIVEAAERRLETLEAIKPRELTQSEVMEFVSGWYQTMLPSYQGNVRPKAFDSDSVARHKSRIESLEASIKHRQEVYLAQNQYGTVMPFARRILQKAGLDTDSQSFGLLCQTLLRAWQHLEETTVERLKGNFNFKPSDNIMDLIGQHQAPTTGQPQAPTAGTASGKTLSDLIAAYTEEHGVTWSKSTISATDTVFTFLKWALGDNKKLSEISRPVGREIFDKLKRLPKGRTKNKELDGLSFDRCLAKAEKLGLPTIGVKTINGTYMAFIIPMFNWAVSERWIDFNPFENLKARQTKKAKAEALENKKPTYSTSQLQTLFNSEPWTPRDEYHEGKPFHFWGAFIALFHGFRLGEVSSLLVSDIIPDDDNEGLAFRLKEHFDDGEDERTFKTANATRVVPIHPELIKLGFLRFVNEQRATGHRQLFPEARLNKKKGKWGAKLGEWFNARSRATETKPSRCTFHSLRHTFEDALRDAGLHGTAEGQALGGRKTDYRIANANADTVADNYGTRFKTSRLKPLIAKIQYPGLDLSHLYVD